MNAHLHAYLKTLAWNAMGPACGLDSRAAQRAAVLAAVQAYPAHHRAFIANCAWARLGYGGGI